MKKAGVFLLLLCLLPPLAAFAQSSLEDIEKVPAFSLTDQRGAGVTDAVFQNAEYTLLVFWGTWCGECGGTLAGLAGARQRLLDMGIQIVGICEDGQEQAALAAAMLEENGADFVSIIPDDAFYDAFVSLCYVFPSAMLVDGGANVITRQFLLETDADAVAGQLAALLQAPQTLRTAQVLATASPRDSIEAYYQRYLEDMRAAGVPESNLRIQNVPRFIELQMQAYAYVTDDYYCHITIYVNGQPEREIRRYITGGNLREEEYVGGEIAYMRLYNAQADTLTSYAAETETKQVVANASRKSYKPVLILYGGNEATATNAIAGELSMAILDGKEALLSHLADYNGFDNKVWFDPQTGVLLQQLQTAEDFTYLAVYDVTPAVSFSDDYFVFDPQRLSAESTE